jgi:hypothetical protein
MRADNSRIALKSNMPINDQIRAFLRNDPSATHLGEIGTIFGGGSDNQIAQSVKRLGSIAKMSNGGDLSTDASTAMKKNKLNMVKDKYLVQKPSSITLEPKSSMMTSRTGAGNPSLKYLEIEPVAKKNQIIYGSTVRLRNATTDNYEQLNIQTIDGMT